MFEEENKDSSISIDNNSKNSTLVFIWETIKVVVISLAIIWPIRYYLVQPFFVKGASMEPSLDNGDYLLVDEISYRFNEPKRGDIIVFRYPHDPSQFYIKRIIGLPKETIEVRNNIVKVYNISNKEGLVLKEEYLDSYQETLGDSIVKLEDDGYFVMGDNRLQSSDSRRWGSVGRKFITGKASIRLWPLNNIDKLPEITYE